LHLAIHPIETRTKWLVQARSLYVFGDTYDFERAGGVVVDLGSNGEYRSHGCSRLFAGVHDGGCNSAAFEGDSHSADLLLRGHTGERRLCFNTGALCG
jgi:hypothetical protein